MGILAAMRHATSYGIVDRKLLFDRYLHRMSLEGMALYLFLVLAADREGRSYYGNRTIGEILRLSPVSLAAARAGLIAAGLIVYRAPNWWVKGLSLPSPFSEDRSRAFPSSSSEFTPTRGIVPDGLKSLLRSLEGKR